MVAAENDCLALRCVPSIRQFAIFILQFSICNTPTRWPGVNAQQFAKELLAAAVPCSPIPYSLYDQSGLEWFTVPPAPSPSAGANLHPREKRERFCYLVVCQRGVSMMATENDCLAPRCVLPIRQFAIFILQFPIYNSPFGQRVRPRPRGRVGQDMHNQIAKELFAAS
jgi:hypothetical protein